MNLDLRGKVIAATFAISLVITPLGVLGFKNWQAHAAAPSTAALSQPSEGTDAAQAQILAAVPDSDTAAPVEAGNPDGGASSTPQPLWHSYQVVEGDTLSGIASRYGISVDTLLASNGLDEDALLAIGQELVIPTADGVIHETTDGDSFWYLASLYQVSLQSIIDANPEVNPDTLAPKTKLFIPGAKPVRVRQEPVSRGGETAAAETKSASGSGSGSVFSLWPTSGSITSYYGWREDPVYGGQQFHKGIDIGAPSGEPVVAVGSGRVVMAGSYSGYGLTVMIDHQNGLVTRYSHLSRISVTEGQRVSAGQVVGAVGSTGKSTGPHLDFGVNVGSETANPLNYLP